MHLSNYSREIYSFITNAAHFFDDVIINDSIPITNMPAVLQNGIFESWDEAVVGFWYNTK